MKPLNRFIYYTPGMITLLILPVLITGYLNQLDTQRKQQRVVEVNWNPSARPDFDTTNHQFVRHPAHILKRNWMNIDLTGNRKSDDLKIEFARLRAQKIETCYDTLNGIHFTFGETAQYETFVSVLNMLLREKITSYAILDDGIWVAQWPRVTSPIPMLVCGTMWHTKTLQSVKEEFIMDTLSLHKTWLSMIALLFLTLLGIAIHKVLALS